MILQHVCSQRCVPSREYHNIKGQLIQEMSRLDTFYKLQPSKTEPPKSIVSVERSAPVDDTFDLRSSRYRGLLILLSTQPTTTRIRLASTAPGIASLSTRLPLALYADPSPPTCVTATLPPRIIPYEPPTTANLTSTALPLIS